MFRATTYLSKQAGRTIVRDPRKKRVPAVVPSQKSPSLQERKERIPLAFEPNQGNQRSVGTLGSYALAGAGMAIGFTIVGAVFGGF